MTLKDLPALLGTHEALPACPGAPGAGQEHKSHAIQEETHRFAIEFNRLQRKGRVQGSVLDNIPGVGEKRRAQLIKHFKSVKNIRAASLEELSGVVPKNTAQAVFAYFRKERQRDDPLP